MAKQQKVPSTLMLQISEYIIPTVIAFAIIMSVILTYYAIQKVTNPTTTTDSTVVPTVVDADPFETKTLKAGTGTRTVKSGDTITVNYKGTLKTDGTEFDSSYKEGRTPYTFTVGVGVIDGWNEGVIGMKVGEKRQLQIPASKGYGAVGNPPTIPGNATLMFEIELISIK